AVLLKAGLPLDRALALAIDNIEDSAAARALTGLLQSVREGAPLSRAMLDHPALFSAADSAMAEAGEASGRLGEALERLAVMLKQAANLRRTIVSAMIYPAALLVIAVGVIALMLLFVVPQFESMLAAAQGNLPWPTLMIMALSQALRAWWPILLLLAATAVMGAARLRHNPAFRRGVDRAVLALPLVGELVRRIETARFAHTLGALVEGGVPLPQAMALARRTVANSVMGEALDGVVATLREGGGLATPLAQTGVLPRMAVAFLRTGEEASQLALMLARLAEVLDSDVQTRLERLVAVLTPAITVILGASVAGIIAAVMSAILGFNELAVAQP
ncbi:MAG: type II secretion system F family protein, partial [Novosphingobium sp.]|nr:type II secretion system F family protein [Novosphingobium sp.]